MYQVKLEVFEGPFDLLLHLIKINEIDIYEIPIGLITAQYLEYLELMKECDIELSSEFLIIAAELLKIKSAMLLPQDEKAKAEIEELKQNFINRIIEYKKYKEVAVKLELMAEEQSDYYKKPATIDKEILQGDIEYVEVDLFTLLQAYKNFLENFEKRKPPVIKGVKYTVEEKIDYILKKLDNNKMIKFSEVFCEAESKLEIVVMFIALLELIKLQKIRAYQTKEFDEIYITKKEEVISS